MARNSPQRFKVLSHREHPAEQGIEGFSLTHESCIHNNDHFNNSKVATHKTRQIWCKTHHPEPQGDPWSYTSVIKSSCPNQTSLG
jgi:hypothetical protein